MNIIIFCVFEKYSTITKKCIPYLAIHLKSMWDKLNFPEQEDHCSIIR